MVRRYNKMNYQYENGYFIVLSKQKLSVYKGNSKEGQLLHSFSFPHGTDCIFLDEYKGLTITDTNGQQIKLAIDDEELKKYLLIEWFSTKLFSDFEKKPAEDSKIQKYLNLKFRKIN